MNTCLKVTSKTTEKTMNTDIKTNELSATAEIIYHKSGLLAAIMEFTLICHKLNSVDVDQATLQKTLKLSQEIALASARVANSIRNLLDEKGIG